jgi:prepilin-type N-terminal cleavage/methylation domain-containing protein
LLYLIGKSREKLECMRLFMMVQGVTLLEMMLVLAIASMIIAMSVRYYQSAMSSAQASYILEQIHAINAVADELAPGTGTYNHVGFTALKPLLPTAGLNTPWGANIQITSADSYYQLTIPRVPRGVCPLRMSRLATNNHYSANSNATMPLSATACTGKSSDISFYYLANP